MTKPKTTVNDKALNSFRVIVHYGSKPLPANDPILMNLIEQAVKAPKGASNK